MDKALAGKVGAVKSGVMVGTLQGVGALFDGAVEVFRFKVFELGRLIEGGVQSGDEVNVDGVCAGSVYKNGIV